MAGRCDADCSQLDGFWSDIGRTYVVGTPSAKQREFYELVRKGWETAYSLVKPGTITGDIDAATRKVFGKYEKYFDHEMGHGIGYTMEPPALAKNSQTPS